MSNKVIIDFRTGSQTVKTLSELGFQIVKTKPLNSLYMQVCGHSDMQLHITGESVICQMHTYEYYKKIITECEVISGQAVLENKYPYDIAYNVCRLGKYIISKREYTDKKIIGYYEKNGFEFINVKQGYAKCNICVVNDESAITSDNGIYNSLKKRNIDVLKIQEGNIELYDMQGFIGGASGLLNDSLLAFNGDIKTHPDCANITAFCRNAGVDVISLSAGALQDIGSIFVL